MMEAVNSELARHQVAYAVLLGWLMGMAVMWAGDMAATKAMSGLLDSSYCFSKAVNFTITIDGACYRVQGRNMSRCFSVASPLGDGPSYEGNHSYVDIGKLPAWDQGR